MSFICLCSDSCKKTIILALSFFRDLILWDREMNKNVYSTWLNHLNFLSTMAADSKMDCDYYLSYLMLIKTVFHFVCNKGRTPNQIVVSLVSTIHICIQFLTIFCVIFITLLMCLILNDIHQSIQTLLVNNAMHYEWIIKTKFQWKTILTVNWG